MKCVGKGCGCSERVWVKWEGNIGAVGECG